MRQRVFPAAQMTSLQRVASLLWLAATRRGARLVDQPVTLAPRSVLRCGSPLIRRARHYDGAQPAQSACAISSRPIGLFLFCSAST